VIFKKKKGRTAVLEEVGEGIAAVRARRERQRVLAWYEWISHMHEWICHTLVY
jgi:porphobilinogen deaminase